MARIYVASSWRNPIQPDVVFGLRLHGHEVYDFRNPPARAGFGWEAICEDWRNWKAEQYIAALGHPIAEAGYKSDMDAMAWADICVLVLPCGRSAHLEAGWFAGKGKPVYVLTRDGEEPELMVKMCTGVFSHWSEMMDAIDGKRPVSNQAVSPIPERASGPDQGLRPAADG